MLHGSDVAFGMVLYFRCVVLTLCGIGVAFQCRRVVLSCSHICALQCRCVVIM